MSPRSTSSHSAPTVCFTRPWSWRPEAGWTGTRSAALIGRALGREITAARIDPDPLSAEANADGTHVRPL